MRFWRSSVLGCLAACSVVAQSDASVTPNRSYSLLRDDEDWSFLANPALRNDFWDPIKYIPLACEGCYVTLGGEVREVFEQVGNDNWGKQPYMNAFVLQPFAWAGRS